MEPRKLVGYSGMEVSSATRAAWSDLMGGSQLLKSKDLPFLAWPLTRQAVEHFVPLHCLEAPAEITMYYM